MISVYGAFPRSREKKSDHLQKRGEDLRQSLGFDFHSAWWNCLSPSEDQSQPFRIPIAPA